MRHSLLDRRRSISAESHGRPHDQDSTSNDRPKRAAWRTALTELAIDEDKAVGRPRFGGESGGNHFIAEGAAAVEDGDVAAVDQPGELAADLLEQIKELLSTMVDGRLMEGGMHLRRNGHRPRQQTDPRTRFTETGMDRSLQTPDS